MKACHLEMFACDSCIYKPSRSLTLIPMQSLSKQEASIHSLASVAINLVGDTASEVVPFNIQERHISRKLGKVTTGPHLWPCFQHTLVPVVTLSAGAIMATPAYCL